MSWVTERQYPFGLKESLVKRGSKREVEEGNNPGDKEFVVHGSSKLGDEYEYYIVSIDNGKLTCSCQSHSGGMYRPQCSHMGSVVAAGLVGPEDEGEGVDDGTPSQDQGATEVPADPDFDPVELGLPEKFSRVRDYQGKAVKEIEEAFESGVKVVFLDAPTGSGKTLIAETLRRHMRWKGLYTCTTKGLQSQFISDFPESVVLMGRRNYPTELYPESFYSDFQPLTADDCNWSQDTGCSWCSEKWHCPYEVAKETATLSPLAVLNMSYMLGEWQSPKSKFKDRNLVVIDEADELESNLMSAIEVKITKKRMEQLNLPYPEKKTVASSWKEWVDNVLPMVHEQRGKFSPTSEDVREIRERKYMDNLHSRLVLLAEGLSDPESPRWVYTDYQDGDVVFRPVKVDQEARGMVWENGQNFLLMSASIISPDEMAESLGLEDDEWEIVTVPSQFPPENRPIYVSPVADVTYKNREEADEKLSVAIKQIQSMHPTDNILVHTVSYRQARVIHERLRDPSIHTYQSGGRDSALDDFLSRDGGQVLLAPSLDRGVDLPDELCRVQVICKVPWPNMQDKQVNARLYSQGGQLWYRVQAVRTMVQMSGRGVRHKDDWCTTYIIDRQFLSNLYKKGKQLFPEWWRDAVIMEKVV